MFRFLGVCGKATGVSHPVGFQKLDSGDRSPVSQSMVSATKSRKSVNVDSLTKVPEDLYGVLMQEAKLAKRGGAHSLVQSSFHTQHLVRTSAISTTSTLPRTVIASPNVSGHMVVASPVSQSQLVQQQSIRMVPSSASNCIQDRPLHSQICVSNGPSGVTDPCQVQRHAPVLYLPSRALRRIN